MSFLSAGNTSFLISVLMPSILVLPSSTPDRNTTQHYPSASLCLFLHTAKQLKRKAATRAAASTWDFTVTARQVRGTGLGSKRCCCVTEDSAVHVEKRGCSLLCQQPWPGAQVRLCLELLWTAPRRTMCHGEPKPAVRLRGSAHVLHRAGP